MNESLLNLFFLKIKDCPWKISKKLLAWKDRIFQVTPGTVLKGVYLEKKKLKVLKVEMSKV